MPIFTDRLPLSLYVHLPWCVRKCPYCDFNSHVATTIPETAYVDALLHDLDQHLSLIKGRPIISIFFGGGTPSLFSADAIQKILTGVKERISFAKDIEITLEANPGAIDQARFQGFRAAGINRLSIGIQSFQNEKLKQLGRIHDQSQALQAIAIAKDAGFSNFNLDLMYGLPQQSIEDALFDIKTALACEPTHLSWYQLTIEPNTLFYHQRPTLPEDDYIWQIQEAGLAALTSAGFQQYEVSAHALPQYKCQHNVNYWSFGDYLGIGAGAHSKITQLDKGQVIRWAQVKHPRDYLDPVKRSSVRKHCVEKRDLIFEFMLNALRLTDGVSHTLFKERTALSIAEIMPILDEARERRLLNASDTNLRPTELGRKFLNDLTALFLP